MPKVKNGAVYYVKEPTGHIVPGEHVKYVEEEIDLENVPLGGGVLLKTLFLSSDPYLIYRMRDPSIPMFCPPILIGDVVDNAGVGRVLRSDDPNFEEGDLVYAYLEFREYHVYPGKISHMFKFPLTKIERLPNLPLSVYVGTLGMPGTTAYQGLKGFAGTALQPKEVNGKTVQPTLFVSGGAGPVGTFVIEYARQINPCVKIIASAGSAKKVDIMRSCGADVVFNYKEERTFDVLRREGPIDIYWDNVAGPVLDDALLNFNRDGLIIACGAISQASGADSAVRHFEEIFQRNLSVKGFIVYTGETAHLCGGFHAEAVPLALAGKITSREHRYAGLREAPRALADLHHGANTGKAVVVVHDE